MKRSISFILLIVFLFISDGYYLYFIYLQHKIHEEVKSEIRKGIREKDLSLIVVPVHHEKEIFWTQKDKEFRYRGTLYDVIRIEVKGQKKYYYCLNDAKENQLMARYRRTNKQRTNTLQQLKRVMSGKYLPGKAFFKNMLHNMAVYFTDYQFTYISTIPEINAPPPKFNFFS